MTMPQAVPELRIEPARADQREIVASLLEAYLADLGAPSAYPWLTSYWSEQGRFPYLFFVDGEVVGFALVRRLPGRFDFEMAEFYVAPAWRRRGVGRMAVNRLLHMHPGRWRVRVSVANEGAAGFWLQVLHVTARPEAGGLQFEVRWPPPRATLSPRQRRLVQSWYAGAILIAISWWLAGYSVGAAKLFWVVVGWPVAVLYARSLGEPATRSEALTNRSPENFEHLAARHPWLRTWVFLCALVSVTFCAAAVTRRIDAEHVLGARALIAVFFVALSPLIVATQIEQFRDYADMDDIL